MFFKVGQHQLKKWPYLLLIIIFIVRISLLLQQRMYADELVYINLLNKVLFFDLIQNLFVSETNPVFMFFLYKLFHTVSQGNVLLMRVPFFIAGLLSSVFFYYILKERYSTKTAYIGAMFFVLSPQSIAFGNMFRNYALTECVFLALLYFVFFEKNVRNWLILVLLFLLMNTHFVGMVWGVFIFVFDFFSKRKIPRWGILLVLPALIQFICLIKNQQYDHVDWLNSLTQKELIFWTIREGFSFSGKLLDLVFVFFFLVSAFYLRLFNKSSDKKIIYLLISHLVFLFGISFFTRSFVYWNSVWGDKVLIYILVFASLDYFIVRGSKWRSIGIVAVLFGLFIYQRGNVIPNVDYFEVVKKWKSEKDHLAGQCTLVCHIGAEVMTYYDISFTNNRIYNQCNDKQSISLVDMHICKAFIFLDLKDSSENLLYENFVKRNEQQKNVRIIVP